MGSSRTSPRRCSRSPASRVGRRCPAGPASCGSIRRRDVERSLNPVNPLLAIGQILVSIALMIAILLQARGVGLSGTFGGDSAVYRSRRGVERRLWQFTIILLVLFVVFSLAAFILAPATTPAAA